MEAPQTIQEGRRFGGLEKSRVQLVTLLFLFPEADGVDGQMSGCCAEETVMAEAVQPGCREKKASTTSKALTRVLRSSRGSSAPREGKGDEG